MERSVKSGKFKQGINCDRYDLIPVGVKALVYRPAG